MACEERPFFTTIGRGASDAGSSLSSFFVSWLAPSQKSPRAQILVGKSTLHPWKYNLTHPIENAIHTPPAFGTSELDSERWCFRPGSPPHHGGLLKGDMRALPGRGLVLHLTPRMCSRPEWRVRGRLFAAFVLPRMLPIQKAA